MIARKTVIILGAGASRDFGFPVGSGLVDEVYRGLRKLNSPFAETLRELDHSDEKISQFREQLRRSGQYSVDAFLENRPDLVDIGKAAIAYLLISKEDPNLLFGGYPEAERKDHWLRHVVSKMMPLAGFQDNQISFITYNYDRSVEEYLYQTLTANLGDDSNRLRQLMSSVPVVHLHGLLGRHIYPLSPVTNGRYYTTLTSASAVITAMDSIRIINDVDGLGEEFKRAKELLHAADLVVFLGFGWGATNLSRLEIADLADGSRKVLGTTVGLSKLDEARIRSHFNDEIELQPQESLTFLRQNVVLN